MTGRADFKAMVLLAALLIVLAPARPAGAVGGDEPERPPPWGDRWEPPRPPDIPVPETPVDAASLAADCNEDGTVRVGTDLEVRGGSGTLAVDCRVEIADAATLTLIDVTLAGPHAFEVRCGAAGRLIMANSYLTLLTRIGIGGEGGAAAVIRDSELSSVAGGAIEIVLAGTGAEIALLDSMIMSDGVTLIDISPRADEGRIKVRNVTLAAGGGAAGALSLSASLGGLAGDAVVRESHLVGAQIAIETGAQGRTEVRDNLIETLGDVRIATGDGGRCESTGNDPETACRASIEGGASAVSRRSAGDEQSGERGARLMLGRRRPATKQPRPGRAP